MDKQRFSSACDRCVGQDRMQYGIGNLNEKTLHAVCKYYLEPDESCHEILVAPYTADIYDSHKITEIQTGAFDQLRPKLERFLQVSPVTVVHPVAQILWYRKVNSQTGEIGIKRRSPRGGCAASALAHLYHIKSLLKHPQLTIRILLLEVDEYRIDTGMRSKTKSKTSRHDRIPIAILGDILLEKAEDYRQLLPKGLTDSFTAKEFRSLTKQSISDARCSVHVLSYLDILEKIGKTGNQIIYRIKN